MYTLNDMQRAARATADFFRKNPHLRTHGELAIDKDGLVVHPMAADAACWCAVGRMAVELDYPLTDSESALYDRFDAALAGRGSAGTIYGVNDGDETADGLEIIKHLERFADEGTLA